MANPIRPSEFRALVPTSDDDLCAVLVKMFKFQLLYYRWHNYFWDSNGQITAQAETDICADIRAKGGC